MSRLQKVAARTDLRKRRVRAKLHGTSERPRLAVYISHQQVIAQIINDDTHQTLAYVSSLATTSGKATLTELAVSVGLQIGTKAKAKKINKVVFDRGDKLYHGRIKALADAAREKGLEF